MLRPAGMIACGNHVPEHGRAVHENEGAALQLRTLGASLPPEPLDVILLRPMFGAGRAGAGLIHEELWSRR